MSQFLHQSNVETILTEAHRVLAELLAFMTSTGHVATNTQTRPLPSIFAEAIPREGCALDEILAVCRDSLLPGVIRQSHPLYLAFPDCGNAVSGFIAELYVALLNQNLIAVEKSAPSGTFFEIQVIRWLRQLIGYDLGAFPQDAVSVGGLMVGGGVGGNAVALLAARSRAYPNARMQGMCGVQRPPAVFISGDTLSHYSHLASAWWVGLGEENVFAVDSERDFTMSIKHLASSMALAHKDGRRCVAIVAQAGDSRTMAIDRLHEIADLAEKYGAWFHVDACHGGALLFSAHRRALLEGISRADSVVIDGHKGLCLPYTCSALLFKSPIDLRRLAKSTDITIKPGSYDLGQITPFAGSRRFDSLKLWMLVRHLGVNGIGHLVDSRFELASYWKSLIDRSELFVSLNDVTINSVAFSISPGAPARLLSPDRIGRLNQEVHDRVYLDGRCCIHSFDLRDCGGRLGFPRGTRLRVLGVTIGNPLTKQHHLDEAFAIVSRIAADALGDGDC